MRFLIVNVVKTLPIDLSVVVYMIIYSLSYFSLILANFREIMLLIVAIAIYSLTVQVFHWAIANSLSPNI